jgi:predicted phosphodiesterase
MEKSKTRNSLRLLIFFCVLLMSAGCEQKPFGIIPYDVKDINKKHFIIVSDLHLYSPFATNIEIEKIPKGESTIFLGDIYEVIWAKHEEIEIVRRKVKLLREEVGNSYIRGNHEGNAFRNLHLKDENIKKIEYGDKAVLFSEFDFAIRSVRNQSVLFVHGHKGIDPDYDAKKIQKLEQMNGGRGLLFQLIIPIAAWLRDIKSNTLSDLEIKNAIRLATSFNCQTIVFGHKHVDSPFDQTFKDDRTDETIRIISVPRGITHLEL